MTRVSHALGTALLTAGIAAILAGCADEYAPSADFAGRPASAQVAGGRQCFRPDQVTNFNAVSDRIVNLRINGNRVFQMRLMGACPDIDWSQRLGIESTGSSWICSGIDATVIEPTQIGPQRCPVTGLRELTPPEVAALPPRDRP